MMKERILQIMRRENMTQQEFAKAIEVSPASLSNIFNGKTNPTNNHVSAIHRRFPDININWLMFGEGEPYIKEKLKTPTSLFDEIWAKPEDSPEDAKYIKDFQSNELRNTSDNVDSKLNKEENLNSNIETQKVQDNRKVIKIMVFYSDNTFETFSSDFFK